MRDKITDRQTARPSDVTELDSRQLGQDSRGWGAPCAPLLSELPPERRAPLRSVKGSREHLFPR